MTYILLIWTAVACSSSGDCRYDWRPLGEFHYSVGNASSAQTLCEDAARQLGLKAPNYRCVRSR